MQLCRFFKRIAGPMFGMAMIFSGCSAMNPWSKEELSSGQTRILPPEIAKKEISVARVELLKRLRERGTPDGVRLIPILKGQSYEIQPFPEYRIFGVKTGSVYELLGLQNADIVVSAQGFVIRDPRVFPEYVSLLRNQPDAAIEVRREGRPLLLAVTIKD